MAQLELKHVNKTFQRKTGESVHVLNDINLSIEKGEVIAIIGTNGAGKSTLLNALTGSINIDSGEILLADKMIQHLDQVQVAKYIGRVFQDPSMGTAPRMTVFENLMLAKKRGEFRGLGKSLTHENFEAMQEYVSKFHLNLENRLELPIENLSGGQRQIISLLMATMQQPELLLLDEHTAALDPRTANQVMTTTQEMVRAQELTTIMITHHLHDALKYSDRIILMHHGQIKKIYTQDEIAHLKAGDLYQYMEDIVLN